jgi:hypothetical protein
MLGLQSGPEWRNWQTQQTQNLPELCSVWVRLPPPGPFWPFLEYFLCSPPQYRCKRNFCCSLYARIVMVETVLKRFEEPDEVRFEKGKFELVRIGGMTIDRATYEPGWK